MIVERDRQNLIKPNGYLQPLTVFQGIGFPDYGKGNFSSSLQFPEPLSPRGKWKTIGAIGGRWKFNILPWMGTGWLLDNGACYVYSRNPNSGFPRIQNTGILYSSWNRVYWKPTDVFHGENGQIQGAFIYSFCEFFVESN